MEHYKNVDLTPIIYTNSEGAECIEEFRDIEDFDGFYQVSDLGRVKYAGKLTVDSIGRTTGKQPRIRIQTVNGRGYLYVVLRNKGKNFTKTVHRLVCSAFYENPENKCCVNHKDSVKTNNVKSNLEWCTVRENSRHWIANDVTQSSKYLGVSFDTLSGKWNCAITLEGKVYNLGRHESEFKAHFSYEKALQNWECCEELPPLSPRINYTSKYEGIYFKAETEKWCGQYAKDNQFYFVGSFNTEAEAKVAYDEVDQAYKETGIFPVKSYASKYMYVSWKEDIKRWQVAIPINGKRKYIGVYKTEDEAAEKIKELMGQVILKNQHGDKAV